MLFCQLSSQDSFFGSEDAQDLEEKPVRNHILVSEHIQGEGNANTFKKKEMEWGFEFARDGWVGLRNGWMAGWVGGV